MTDKVIEKVYLTRQYQNFLDEMKVKLTGALPDLETSDKTTLVAAINEVLRYLSTLTDITLISYADFKANNVFYQEADVDAKICFKAYQINEAFSEDDHYYQAGTMFYAISHSHITSPIDREVYDWQILPYEAGLIGDMNALDTRIEEEKTVAGALNHILKDMEVTIETSTDDDTLLKKYTIYQGIDEDTRVQVAEIDIPKDLVVTEGVVITADGTEVIGKDAEGFDIFAIAGEKYLRLTIANQEQKVYILVKDLVDVYTAEEDAAKVQLAISDTNEISATIVTESLERTDLEKPVQNDLNLVGYKQDAAEGEKQLTTTAQTLREAVNELDAKQGDETLPTTATTLSGAIIEHENKFGDMTQLRTAEKTNFTGVANELLTAIETNAEDILKRLHLIATANYADFVANYKDNPTIAANSTVIILDEFEAGGVEYKPGTWAYLFDNGTTKEWRYMNNGGGGDDIYVEVPALPSDNTPSEIADIKTNALYVVETDGGAKNTYVYLKRSDTDRTQNEWLLISSDSKGIEWIGTYNYVATHVIIDPDTGEQRTVVTPWEATPEQLAEISKWVLDTYGRAPEMNDLVTLTVDQAYYGQYLFKNTTWNEYSSLTKATKAQYGVTIFSTMDDYDAGVTNKAIDPWLLKQILNGLLDDYYNKEETDDLLNEKVGYVYLQDQYYDKTVVETKLKALQKAYVVTTKPEEMTPEQLEKYYGSLIYYRDHATGSTTTYIVDSTGVIENLGDSGISLDGYVQTNNPKFLSLSDIRLVDEDGNPQTVQQQLDKKLDAATGAITTVIDNDLIVNRAVISNSNGKIAASTVTATELGMLKGIDTTDPINKTIELRLQALENGGGGGTPTSAINFVTELPTTGASIYSFYRLTIDTPAYPRGYYVWNGAQWLRVDNVGGMTEVTALPAVGDPTMLYKNINTLKVYMYTGGVWTELGGGGGALNAFINGVQLEGNKTSEELKIVKQMTKAEYNALSVAEQINGTMYLITDDNAGTPIYAQVIDALNSYSGNDALSANQGRILNGRVAALESSSITSVVDNLYSTSSIAALSANQGRVLKQMIDAIVPQTTIITDNLTTIATGTALDARQGKVLKDLIDNMSNLITSLTTRMAQAEAKIQTLEQTLADLYDYDPTLHVLTLKKINP